MWLHSGSSSGRISGGFLGGHWLGDPLWLWWELVTSHVVVDMDLVVVSSSCELGSLLASRAWFSSIGVGGNCIGGRSIESSIGGIPVQAVNRAVHSSNWYLGRRVLLGVGVPLGDPLGDGVSSACVEALVGVRHSSGFSIACALSVSTAVAGVYRRSLCFSDSLCFIGVGSGCVSVF